MIGFCKIEILLRLALDLKASYCDVRKTRKDIVSLTKASNKRKDRSSLDEKKKARLKNAVERLNHYCDYQQ